jgi:hypothetical protein
MSDELKDVMRSVLDEVEDRREGAFRALKRSSGMTRSR